MAGYNEIEVSGQGCKTTIKKMSQNTDRYEQYTRFPAVDIYPLWEKGGYAHTPLSRTPPLKRALGGSDSAFPLPLAGQIEGLVKWLWCRGKKVSRQSGRCRGDSLSDMPGHVQQ